MLMKSSRKAMRKPIWVKESPRWRKNNIMNGSKYRWFFKKPYKEKRLIIVAAIAFEEMFAVNP